MGYPLFTFAEVPTGAVDGSNTGYILVAIPSPTLSLRFWKNGILLTSGADYTLSGANISTNIAPVVGDILLANYQTDGLSDNQTNGFVDGEVPSGFLDTSNRSYTLSQPVVPTNSVELYWNGVLLKQGLDYSYDGNITLSMLMSVPPAYGDQLVAFYQTSGSCCFPPVFDFSTQPVGTLDGVNRNFTLPGEINPPWSLQLYWNGVLMTYGLDYCLSWSGPDSDTNLIWLAPNIPNGTDIFRAYYRLYQYPSSVVQGNPVVGTLRLYTSIKIDIIPYLRKYLNDINGKLWPDTLLLRLISEADMDIQQLENFIWRRFALNIIKGQALYTMPDNTKSITRITYKSYAVDALTQRQVATLSPVYMTQVSRPRWFTEQFEGYRALRLYPVPYEDLPPISDQTTIYYDTNIMEECIVSAYYYPDYCQPFLSVPDYIARRIVRYYALWKCYQMEGLGQNLLLAAYYLKKYEKCKAIAHDINAYVYANKNRQLTDVGINRPWKKHPPILPPNFGTIVDFPNIL